MGRGRGNAASLRRRDRWFPQRQLEPMGSIPRVPDGSEESAQPMGRDDLASVVVVTWNSAEYLNRCLEAVAKQTWPNRELVVVDNASSDDSATIAEARGARVIRNDSNRGFAAAANQGIRETRGAFVLLLNPDCFLEPSFIEQILGSIGDAGAATGKLLLADGSGHV